MAIGMMLDLIRQLRYYNEAYIGFELDYAEEFAAYEKENRPRPIIERFWERPFRHVFLFGSLAYTTCQLLPRWNTTADNPFLVGVCILLGIYLADFFTGFIHMWCDMTPLKAVTVKERTVSQWAAYGFHYHHANAQNWNVNDIWYGAIVRAGCSFYFPFVIVMIVLDYFQISHPLLLIVLYACGTSGLLVQIVHAAAHGRWSDHKWDRNFAILTGWSTPLLNFIFTYVFLENLNSGIKPEEQQRVYIENKGKLKWPYYAIFPQWREATGF